MRKLIVPLLALPLALSLAVGLSACVAPADQASSPNGEQPSSEREMALEPIPLGDFSARDFKGNAVTKEIFSDYDLTMVNLWTTTCSYCIQEMPALNELRDELQGDGKSFNIISVCMDVGSVEDVNEDNLAIAREIIEKSGVGFNCLVPDGVLLEGRLKGVQAFPESFFVDREGNVVSEPYVGALGKNHWRVVINDEIERAARAAGRE